MRILSTVGFGLLTVSVVVEGAVLLKTRRQVEALQTELGRREVDGVGEDGPDQARRASTRDFRGGERGDGDRPAQAPAVRTGVAARAGENLPPPRFVPAAASANLAPTIAVLQSPEGREQLRDLVASELDRMQDDRRERERQERLEREQRRVDQVVKQLGLNSDEERRFKDVLAQADTARQQFRQKMEEGNIPRAEIGRQFMALRQQTEQQMKSVLGDQRMQTYQQMTRGADRGPDGRGDVRGWEGLGGRRAGLAGPGGPGAPVAQPVTGQSSRPPQ